MGLPLFSPWTWIRQAHLARPFGPHFYPLQLPPSPLLVRLYLRKRGQLGWQLNSYRLTVRCSWVDGWNIGVNGDRLNGMTVEMSSRRWQGLWDDGSEKQRLSGIQSSDKLPRSIYGAWHVLSFGWFLSWIEASFRLPCTSPIKTTPFISFLYFSQKTHCQSASVIFVRDPFVQLLHHSISSVHSFPW